MSETLQEWLVYGLVAAAALLLVRGALRRRRACENCPVSRISARRRTRTEPAGTGDVPVPASDRDRDHPGDRP